MNHIKVITSIALFAAVFGGGLYVELTKKPSVSIENPPKETVAGATTETIQPVTTELITETKSTEDKSKASAPKSLTLSVNDLLDIPSLEELAFQTGQNTIKNVEQDSRLDNLDNRVSEVEKKVEAPAPTPTPTPAPAPTPTLDPTLCDDTGASNYQGKLPCVYPLPVPDCEARRYGTVNVVVTNKPDNLDFKYAFYESKEGLQFGSTETDSHVFNQLNAGGPYVVKTYIDNEFVLFPVPKGIIIVPSSFRVDACGSHNVTINF